MKKFIIIAGIFLGLIAAGTPVLAAEFVAPSNDQGNVTISSTESYKNLYTVGGNVLVNGPTTGDLYIAGGTVTIENTVEQDVVAGAGTLYINGNVGGDVRVAGGTVIINGRIGGDLVVIGGTVQVSDKSMIANDVIATAGNLDLSAPIAGKVMLNAGKATINSTVGGEVKANAGELTFGSKAVVPGKISYRGSKEANVESGASIGQVDYKQIEQRNASRKALDGLLTLGFILKLVALIIAALILLNLFPRTSEKLLAHFDHEPWINLGIGFVGLFVIPIAAGILLALLVGFYIAIIAFLVYVIVLMISGLVAAVYVGAWVIKSLTKRDKLVFDWQAVVIGIVLLSIVKLIPIVGLLAIAIVMLMAFGLMLRAFYGFIRSEQHRGDAEISN